MNRTETELLRAAAVRFREENLTESGKKAPVPASLDRRVRRLIRREREGKSISIKTLTLLAAALLTVGVVVLGLPMLREAAVKVPVTEQAGPAETDHVPAVNTDPAETDDVPKNEPHSGIGEPAAPTQDPVPTPEEVSGLLSGVNEAITDAMGGGDMTFSRQWLDYTYNIAYLEKLYGGEPSFVDSEEVSAWGAEYASRSIAEQNRMPTLYQAVHELGIPEEDFSALNRWRAQNGGDEMILKEQERYGRSFPRSHKTTVPTSKQYKCSDGEWITLILLDYAKLAGSLYRMLDIEKEVAEMGVTDYGSMVAHRVELSELVASRFALKTADEWTELFRQYDLVGGKIPHFADVNTDEQAWANGFLEHYTFRNGETGILPVPPINISTFTRDPSHYADLPGEHTDEVLAEYGYSEEEIAAMHQRGAVR